MPDLGSISTAIATVKTSMDIAKIIKDSSNSLDEAERKLKIAELISSLADVKVELAEVQDLVREKETEINNLKEKLNEKKSITFDGKFYIKENDDVPFCPICWENNQKMVHLKFCEYYPGGKHGMFTYSSQKEHYICRVCENTYY